MSEKRRIHIGKEIRRVMEEKGHTVTWLSRKYGCSRVNIYKIFDKSSIDTQALLRFSSILDFNFFSLYSDEFSGRSHGTEHP